jgi:uncharacterized protein (TIGR04551 family)
VTPSAPATPAPATPAPAPEPAGPGATPASVNPTHDQQQLATQGAQRPESDLAGGGQQIFSDDWWGRVHPVVELHGYFRTRAELFQELSLGRHNSAFQTGSLGDPQNLAPIPLDNSYQGTASGSAVNVNLCGSNSGLPCQDKTISGANMRLRLDPELIVSDNLRVSTEIFALDNVVLGTTPNSYAMMPASNTPSKTGYKSAGYNPYAPVGFFATTQGAPTAGINSFQNSINVARVWAEYMTPVGQLRFGRMPDHWGLGMIDNSGDGVDSDYQSTIDRLMFVTGIKSMDLYFGATWDFVSTGPTNATPYSIYGGQPYNTCNLCNVAQWSAFVAHKTNPEVQRLELSRGDLVVNGGLYAKFRSQYLDVAANDGAIPLTVDPTIANTGGLEGRRAWAFTPDLWVQLLWQKLRIEAEGAMIYGELGQLGGLGNISSNYAVDIRQWGVATQAEYRAVEDKLDLKFGFGWASGDGNQTSLNPAPTLPTSISGTSLNMFSFNPDYRVDLIFFRNILTRVEGAYYFRPSVDYDFLRHPNGEKFGGGAALIWSRASEFIQTPGHHRDLGIELDVQLYYQSKDGSLNDDPNKLGGFFTMLQYGVFFPLGGLEYLPGQTPNLTDASLSTAQAIRLFLGVVF